MSSSTIVCMAPEGCHGAWAEERRSRRHRLKVSEYLPADVFGVGGRDGFDEAVTVHPVDAHCFGPLVLASCVAIDLDNRGEPLLTVGTPPGPVLRLAEMAVAARDTLQGNVRLEEAMPADGPSETSTADANGVDEVLLRVGDVLDDVRQACLRQQVTGRMRLGYSYERPSARLTAPRLRNDWHGGDAWIAAMSTSARLVSPPSEVTNNRRDHR